MAKAKDTTPRQLSIGALAKATGVPVETLRTWERRYGFPPSGRTDAGHRRYAWSTVETVKAVAEAIQKGHRPSALLSADTSQLKELLSQQRSAEIHRELPPSPLERWLELTTTYDAEALDRELQQHWDHVGGLHFLNSTMSRFLYEIGERWARGELEVRHEHFVSERVQAFLTARWSSAARNAKGPKVVCATVTGEQHVLGLHMAAGVLALSGAALIFLGANTPPEQIANTARNTNAHGVVISASRSAEPLLLRRDLELLLKHLPTTTVVLVGGEGSGHRGALPPNVVHVDSLESLRAWAVATEVLGEQAANVHPALGRGQRPDPLGGGVAGRSRAGPVQPGQLTSVHRLE